MKKICLLFCLLVTLGVNAQKEASNWYFGDNAGLNFDLDLGVLTPLSDGQLATDEGCTSISNINGDLLFYTDGSIVYNANHAVMTNGSNLNGDQSSTQSAIIIPKPNDPNIYYIFTVDTPALDNQDLGFQYSEVDMTLSGGLGAVTATKNQQLLANTTEKLSAVLKDCQSQDIWVITFANQNPVSHTSNPNPINNSFFAYRVTSVGVNTTPVVSTFRDLNISETRGYLTFSPNGKKIASANVGGGLFVYDFDTATGEVSNEQPIDIGFNAPNSGTQSAYGVEFSPNNRFLYASTFNSSTDATNSENQYGALLQYDLNADDISASEWELDQRQTYRGGLQLGPNGKIYRAMSDNYRNGIPFLSVVNNPNLSGVAAGYQHNAIALTADSRQGLPPFIASFFSEGIDIIQNGANTTSLQLCIGETYTLQANAETIPGATYTWTLDDVLLAEDDFDLVISGPGVYRVEIETNGDNCGLLEGEADVSYFEVPVANDAADLTVCEDNPEGNITATFDLASQTAAILGSQNPITFLVKYYTSMSNAMLDVDAIFGDFENTSNPQTLYARIENTNHVPCFDISSFEIRALDTPIIANSDDLESCDDDANPMDGFTQLTLSDFDTAIIGSQDATLFTVSYHNSLANANADASALTNNYTNQNDFNETIYVRIENNEDNACFSTGSIDIIINPIPEAFDADLYQCDEQGMVDGYTTFNLTELNGDLTGNTPDRTTQFYLDPNDAQSDVSEINGEDFSNTTNPQTIYVRVTNDLTGCSNFSELVLRTSDTQINNYTAPSVCDEIESEDGKNTFDLNAFSAEILDGLPTGLDISYYETEIDALLENNPLSSPYENTMPYAQTLYVRVENDNACYGINQVFLSINPRPQLDNDETRLYCLNDFPQTITLDAGLNDSNTGNYSFDWMPTSESEESIEINDPGIYTVVVTNRTTGCESTRIITVEPSNIATIETIDIVDGSLNNNQITIITSGEGEYEYALMDLEGNQTPFQTSNFFSYIPPGIYSVLVKDTKNNCGIEDELISIIGFPLFFTPNNDGKNDTWQVYGLSKGFQPSSEIMIFDRYGKLLTQIKASSQGWDGTFNGIPMPTSDYWFTVTLQDGRTFRDHFTLKR